MFPIVIFSQDALKDTAPRFLKKLFEARVVVKTLDPRLVSGGNRSKRQIKV